jgi:hypothetical protein
MVLPSQQDIASVSRYLYLSNLLLARFLMRLLRVEKRKIEPTSQHIRISKTSGYRCETTRKQAYPLQTYLSKKYKSTSNKKPKRRQKWLLQATTLDILLYLTIMSINKYYWKLMSSHAW